MAVLNIENSFLTENLSVLNFLNKSGQGLYIPLYQREYSWDSDNIEQLLEDLSRGIFRIANGEVSDDAKEIRFLGTIITVVEANRNNIYPVDPQAVPSRIEKLIDGQQRVSTIALMATLLTKRLIEIKNKMKKTHQFTDEVNEICDLWISQKLEKIFSFDLGRGKPKLKPKIARGAEDYWTREDPVDAAYKSELSNYLGHFIEAYVNNDSLPCLSKEKYGNTLLYKNGRYIESWLKKDVATAHEKNNDDFATAIDILDHLKQEALWDYERPNLVEKIKERDYEDKRSESYILSELVQTLAVCHYLLDRCCFTIIQPTDDDWAFDMFQSLNATGTPLTAIETFKPTIVNTINKEGSGFKNSPSEAYFRQVEDFLSEAGDAQKKNKRTNDFLTSFFVTYDGSTISTHFSYQRKILLEAYLDDSTTIADKESLVHRMGNYATFYKNWLAYNSDSSQSFPKLDGYEDADLASMLILFLKSSNHKMAITILGTMYSNILCEKENAQTDFIQAVKIIGAYYFLWRSAYSNAGLDTTYREFFKNLKKENKSCTISEIKSYIKSILEQKDIDTFEKWKEHAKTYLKYDETGNDVIRLALLCAAHDTIPDTGNKGLIKESRSNTSSYLTRQKWVSQDLKTIEHIAPQNNNSALWDNDLYDTQTKPYNCLGNLTLLPQDLNSSAGNKGWKEKLLYYQCVAEKDPARLQELVEQSNQLGIVLNESTMELLKECHYNEHLQSISSLPSNFSWDYTLVNKRTDCLLEIIWKRISGWILE